MMKASTIKKFLPRFSAILLLLCTGVSAQQQLDAGVQFATDKDKAGDTSVFRFTIKVPDEGDLVRTYFPSSVAYLGDPQDPVTLCQESLFLQTNQIQNCIFDEAVNMAEFPLPDHIGPGQYFTYELGYVQNPLYGQQLAGFDIQVLSSADTDSVLFRNTEVSVRVRPGNVQDQSLQTGSVQVAAVTKFTFEFTVTNPVPLGGFVEINFPLTHFEVPSSERDSRLSVNGGSWFSLEQTIWTSGIRFSVPLQDGITADATVVLEIDEMTNPNTMEESNSFSLTTLTATSNKIDTTDTGFVVQMTESADIIVKEFNVQSKEVGKITFFTVSLVLPTVFEAQSYLTVTLPSTVDVNSSYFGCNYYIGFASDSDMGQCSLTEDSRMIRIDKDITQKQVTLRVLSIVNPANTMTTDGFIFHIYDPVDNMIASTVNQPLVAYTPVPGQLSSVTVTRQDSTVGALSAVETNVITVTVESANILQNGEILELKVPHTQLLLAEPFLACESLAPTNPSPTATTCSVEEFADYFLVRYYLSCPQNCAPKSLFTLYVKSGLQNPTWIPSQAIVESIEVTTYTSDLLFKIDHKTSGINVSPALEEGTLSSTNFGKTPGRVGAPTDFQFTLTTLNIIPEGGYLTIQFADDIFQAPEPTDSLLCESEDQTEAFDCTFEVYQSGLVSSISIREPCGANTECSAIISLGFTVSGVRNPRSVKPITNDFSVRTYTQDGYSIDKGFMVANQVDDLELEPALFSAVELLEPNGSTESIITGKLQHAYLLKVVLNNGLYADDGRLKITFPEQVKINSSSASVCLAYDEATTILLDCTVMANETPQTVIVTHSDSSKDYRGASILIKLQNSVRNPPSTKPSDVFMLESALYDAAEGTYFLVDEEASEEIRVTANAPNTFHAITITRSEEEVSTETTLDVCLTPSNFVEANSKLTIVYPEDQAVLSGTQTYKVGQTSLPVLASEPQKVTIVLSTSIEALEEFCFTVSNNIVNPGKTSPPQNSFELTLQTSDNFLIDETVAGVFATPYLSAGPFISAAIESNGQTVGETTSLTASLVLKSELPSGSSFWVQLPSYVLYLPESGASSIECKVDSGLYQTCQDLVSNTDAFGDYVVSLRMLGNSAYLSGANVQLSVRNLRNKFDSSANESNELQTVIQSYDDNDFTINTAIVTLSVPQLVANGQAEVLYTERSDLRVQKPTILTLDVQTRTRLLHSSLLKVHLNSFAFMEPEVNEYLSCTLDSATKLCSLSSIDGSYMVVEMEIDCQGGLCFDGHVLTVAIDGLKNRQSTSRGNLPYEEVFIETFDVTGQSQVDFSNPAAFEGELEPGYVEIRPGSFQLSEKSVGHSTDFSFELDYAGLETSQGDTVQINILQQTSGVDFSGQIFQYSSSARVKADGMSFSSAFVLSDNSGYASALQTQVPATDGTMKITLSRVINLGRVRPLSADFQIFINDSMGGQIALGSSSMVDFDILEPVSFTEIEVERLHFDLASLTDILLSIKSVPIEIMADSVLELRLPHDQLDIRGSGQGRCKLLSESSSPQTECSVFDDGQDYILTTTAVIQASKGSTLQLLISKVFANQQQVTFSNNPIRLSIRNEEYAIGESREDLKLFVEPALTKEKLVNLEYAQTGTVTGQPTELSFEFQLKNNAPDDVVIILTMPSQFLLFDEDGNDSLECKAIGYRAESTVSCEADMTRESRNVPQLVTEIRVYPGSKVENFLKRGFTNELVLKGVRNIDFAKDRAQGTDEIIISVVSQNGFVVAQGTIDEADLPMLTPASLSEPKLLRQSTEIGEDEVSYELSFVTSNNIWSGSYVHLWVPKNEVKAINSRYLTCMNAERRQNMDCELLDETDTDLVVKVFDICEYRYCPSGTPISVSLLLGNSNSIIGTTEQRSFQVTVFAEDGSVNSVMTEFATIAPLLEGTKIPDYNIERKFNLIGGDDFLKFYVPPLQVTVFQDTNMIIEIPNGYANWVGSQMLCQRVLQDGQMVALPCEGVHYENQNTGERILRNIRVFSICNQYHICLKDEPLRFELQVQNPSTNAKPDLSLTRLTLRHATGVDVGQGQQNVELPPMLPNKISVDISTHNMADDRNCGETGAICHLWLNITTANPVNSDLSGGYLAIDLPDQFEIRGDNCKAFVDNGDLSDELECYKTGSDTIEVRASSRSLQTFRDAGNRINVVLQNVRMPLSTEATRLPKVENLELLQTKKGATVFSVLDTNIADESLVQLTTIPSTFKTADVNRQNAEIDSQSSLRLTLESHWREALTFADKEVLLEIRVPKSAGQIESEDCFVGRDSPVQGACSLIGEDADHVTMLVTKMARFCDDLQCQIFINDFTNAKYQVSEIVNLERDSFSFTLYYELADGNQALIYQTIGVGASPALKPIEISIASVILKPAPAMTAEEITLRIRLDAERTDVFSRGKYLLLRFEKNLYQPLYSFLTATKASINEKDSQIRTIDTVDLASNPAVNEIFIDIPERTSGKTIFIEITGLKNPKFASSENSYGFLEAQILGDSLNSWELRAEAKPVVFTSRLEPSSFDKLSIFSTRPWVNATTYLELELVMQSQIGDSFEVEVKIESEFTIEDQNLECSDYFSGAALTCTYDGTSSVVTVQMEKKTQTVSSLDLLAKMIKLGPVMNPSRTLDQSSIEVSVVQKEFGRVYARGSSSVSVLLQGDDCTDGCVECSVDGTCFTCESPSSTPLLVPSTENAAGNCVSICPEGSFQSGDRCIECNSECTTCHSLDQCSSCYGQTDMYFVDGRCLESCPENTIAFSVTSLEQICIRDPTSSDGEDTGDESTGESDADGESSTSPVFEKDWIKEIGPCQADDCKACGLSGDFCAICNDGMVRDRGQCSSLCGSGFFDANGACYQCSPMCQTCSETANLCDSCHDSTFLFTFDKLIASQRLCASTCPPGTFEEADVCKECEGDCNTCEGGPTTCSSCFKSRISLKDLFLDNGTCQEECPAFARKDLDMHKCESLKTIFFSAQSLGEWPMILLYLAVLVPVILLCVSRYFSSQLDCPWELATALFALSESSVKVVLWATLWQCQDFLLFSSVGVSVLCSALLAMVFYETTVMPVQEAMLERRLKKGVIASKGSFITRKAVRVLAYLSSISTVRLLQSGFCGLMAFRQELALESPCFYLKRRVQANKAQMVLTAIACAAAIWCLVKAAGGGDSGGTNGQLLTSDATNTAIGMVVVSIISFALQLRVHREDVGSSSGYRTLSTALVRTS